MSLEFEMDTKLCLEVVEDGNKKYSGKEKYMLNDEDFNSKNVR